MASPTAADRLVEVLIAWNVDTIFGMPGDGINGFMEAPRKRRDEIRFIRVRHEEAAAFAAVGYAKFTGRLGIWLATSDRAKSTCSFRDRPGALTHRRGRGVRTSRHRGRRGDRSGSARCR